MNTEIIRAYSLNIKKRSNLGQAICSVVVHRAFYNIAFGITVGGAAFVIYFLEKVHLPFDPLLIIFAVLIAAITSIFFAAILNSRTLQFLYHYSPEWIKRHFFNKFIDNQQSAIGFQGFITNIEESTKA